MSVMSSDTVMVLGVESNTTSGHIVLFYKM